MGAPMPFLRNIRHAGACSLFALAIFRPAQAQVVNTQTDASRLPFVACNGRVAVRTSESQQGHTDLNLDGDTSDLVLQVISTDTGSVIPVESAPGKALDGGGPLACGGDVFAFGAREANEESDLNGDGDTNDTVLFVYDAAAGVLTPTGLAVSALAASPMKNHLIAFLVPESQQGIDLNGDGDTADNVVFVYDPAAGVTSTNLGQQGLPDMRLLGETVVFRTSEAAQGSTDLNGDGDAEDDVVQIYESPVSGATLTNTMWTVAPALLQRKEPNLPTIELADSNGDGTGDIVAFLTSEAAQGGGSLNADGDTNDLVPQLYCLTGSTCPVLGHVNIGSDASNGFSLGTDVVGLATRERNEMDVANPWFNIRNTVAQAYRISTGTLVNLQLPIWDHPLAAGSLLAFAVHERRAGVDLDGDGRVSNVAVVHLYDAGGGVVGNTQQTIARCRFPDSPKRSEPCMRLTSSRLALQLSERLQNRTDLNGDGDQRDTVVSMWDLSAPRIVNSAIAAEVRSSLTVASELAAWPATERSNGRTDFNGDGDTLDQVLAVYDPLSGTVTLLSALHTDGFFAIDGRTIVFRTTEAGPGQPGQGADLNGDGDTLDDVLQFVKF